MERIQYKLHVLYNLIEIVLVLRKTTSFTLIIINNISVLSIFFSCCDFSNVTQNILFNILYTNDSIIALYVFRQYYHTFFIVFYQNVYILNFSWIFLEFKRNRYTCIRNYNTNTIRVNKNVVFYIMVLHINWMRHRLYLWILYYDPILISLYGNIKYYANICTKINIYLVIYLVLPLKFEKNILNTSQPTVVYFTVKCNVFYFVCIIIVEIEP